MGLTLRTVPVLGLLGLGALIAPGVANAATFRSHERPTT